MINFKACMLSKGVVGSLAALSVLEMSNVIQALNRSEVSAGL